MALSAKSKVKLVISIALLFFAALVDCLAFWPLKTIAALIVLIIGTGALCGCHDAWRDFASPQEGDPDCICSYCAERIEEEGPCDEFGLSQDEDAGLAIRCWNSRNQEARFHPSCFRQVLERGLLSIKTSETAS